MFTAVISLPSINTHNNLQHHHSHIKPSLLFLPFFNLDFICSSFFSNKTAISFKYYNMFILFFAVAVVLVIKEFSFKFKSCMSRDREHHITWILFPRVHENIIASRTHTSTAAQREESSAIKRNDLASYFFSSVSCFVIIESWVCF